MNFRNSRNFQFLIDFSLNSNCVSFSVSNNFKINTQQHYGTDRVFVSNTLPCWPPSGQQVSHQSWIWGFHYMQVTKHASEGIHPGFETQGRRHQKSKTRVSVAPQKGLMLSQIFFWHTSHIFVNIVFQSGQIINCRNVDKYVRCMSVLQLIICPDWNTQTSFLMCNY